MRSCFSSTEYKSLQKKQIYGILVKTHVVLGGEVSTKSVVWFIYSVFAILFFLGGGDEKDVFLGGEQVYIHKCFKLCVILRYLEGINILEVSTTCGLRLLLGPHLFIPKPPICCTPSHGISNYPGSQPTKWWILLDDDELIKHSGT